MYCPIILVWHLMKPSSRQTNVTALDNWEMENSATSSVFERQEVYKKKQIKIKKIKMKLSLTKKSMELVNYAQKLTQNLREVNFSFVYNLWNLKLKLKEHFKRKLNLIRQIKCI